MQHVIVVYRSRNVAIRAYNFLQKSGAMCSLVSTPKAVGVGCGLSVKTTSQVVQTFAKQLYGAPSFVGCYLVKNTLNGSVVTRLT